MYLFKSVEKEAIIGADKLPDEITILNSRADIVRVKDVHMPT